MDVIDYISMTVGGILIVIGLYLFVSGKRESTNRNHVEGFGIKLNVSNPSIILIVLGIGLLLVPRLLPKPAPEPSLIPQEQAAEGPVNPAQINTDRESGVPTQPQSVDTQIVEPQRRLEPEQRQAAVAQAPPPAYLPRGTWQLRDYELNGVDMSDTTSATMMFEYQSSNRISWASSFMIGDMWGNVVNYQYQGFVTVNGSQYTLTFTQSNDPNFFGQSSTPVDLKIENGDVLHMGYMYQGANILLHWVQ